MRKKGQRASDMARYIDADKYVEYLEKEICSKCIDEVCGACGLDSARWIAEEFPTADVAPRAEVAREIFEELEKYMMNSVDVTHTAYKTIGTATFAILKKKYVEGEK